MELSQIREMEDLKLDLQVLQQEEAEIKKQLEKNQLKQKEILDKLASKSDMQYEQDMLAKVYEQRRRK